MAELFAEGGYDAVSIVDAAQKLGVSRATLYRAVPTKEDLLTILFERCTTELTERTRTAIASSADPAEQLQQMIRSLVDAAVDMRSYLAVFLGGAALPPYLCARWQSWTRQFEKLWGGVISANMDRGYLDEGSPVVTARLVLGMIVSVSRWYRPRGKYSSDEIADTIIRMARLGYSAPRSRKASATRAT